MAKGQSTFRQLGKIDGRKYYQVKGVDGIVSQSINQGMSNRVKNDAAYANTRLNNAEFGGAGSTAGAITRALSQKWRYLLVPFATGKLAKDVRSIMMLDATGAWGQRTLIGSNWQKGLVEKLNQYSKNSVEDYTGGIPSARFDSESGMEVAAGFPDLLHNEKLEALGCDGVRVIVEAGVINCSTFDAVSGKYTASSTDLLYSTTDDVAFGAEGDLSLLCPKFKQTAQEANKIFGALVVYLPYKTVNGEKYIMQEHCSFRFVCAE